MWIEWNIFNLKRVGAIDCIKNKCYWQFEKFPISNKSCESVWFFISHHIAWSHKQIVLTNTYTLNHMWYYRYTSVHVHVYFHCVADKIGAQQNWMEYNEKKYAIEFIRWSEMAIQKKILQFFFDKKKINPIDDMIECTHTKLTRTEIYDTTYYMNVHKQFVKIQFYQLKICLSVWVSVFFFYRCSHDSVSFIRSSSISLFMYPVWFQFEWCLIMPHHALIYQITK